MTGPGIADWLTVVSGGPGQYHVVKCGSGGHNIRCRPCLKATPIGMLVMGNTVGATEEVIQQSDRHPSNYCVTYTVEPRNKDRTWSRQKVNFL